jgi:Rap1a immunity proteins
MKLSVFSLGALLTIASAMAASAAVMTSELPPQTVRDLIAICGPAKDDPMMTAAINYCQGYAQGAVTVEMAHEEQRHARKLFCLPEPRPASGSELASFIAWANQEPSRLDEPAIDGMFLYLSQKYPCGKEK